MPTPLSQALSALAPTLSPAATITTPSTAPAAFAAASARWNELGAPRPGAVVAVAGEPDVVATVRWARAHGVPFVAQSGGHAWASWFRVGEGGVVVSMRGMRGVLVDAGRGVAVLEGGVSVGEVMEAAGREGVHVVVGTCNSVGAIPSICGGGIGPLMGPYGAAADSILSARLVCADGIARDVSPTSNPDLWWALRGAAPNFGIVTRLTLRAHPQLTPSGTHYSATLLYPPSALPALLPILTTLPLPPTTCLTLLFTRPPPALTPTIAVALWHAGPETAAREEHFAPLFALGPAAVLGGMVAYARLNDSLDALCGRGGNKLCYSAATNALPSADDSGGGAGGMRAIWDAWEAFSARAGCGMSVVVVEAYSTARAQAVPLAETAVGPAVRGRRFFSFVCTIFGAGDEALVVEAKAVGDDFRARMAEAEEGEGRRGPFVVYPNFAVGDETPEQLYGGNLERLRALKKEYDPEGVFSHFAPIPIT